jgi:hypothetical protein
MAMKRMKQVRVEDELWKAAKHSAIEHGLTLGDWLHLAIKTQLEAEKFTQGMTEEDVKEFRGKVEYVSEALAKIAEANSKK